MTAKVGGPCVICGTFIFYGLRGAVCMERHFQEEHGKVLVIDGLPVYSEEGVVRHVGSHTSPGRRKRPKERQPELFDRREYLR